jgi:hypothetical protein
MRLVRSLFLSLGLFTAPATWALDGADATVAESLELMAEGIQIWRRGESEDDQRVAEEGVFTFYLGELRARAWLLAHPEMFGSEAEQSLSMFYSIGNESISGWVGGDPEGLADIVERVLAHDRANPDLAIPADAMEQARAAFEDFRLQILDQADEIRAQRLAAGEEVR